jgi:hypothetical protein
MNTPHRNDFTPKDTPPPYRPLSLGEKTDGEILIDGKWQPMLYSLMTGNCGGAQPDEPKQRTKAPLP